MQVPIGQNLLEAAHANDVDLEGRLGSPGASANCDDCYNCLFLPCL